MVETPTRKPSALSPSRARTPSRTPVRPSVHHDQGEEGIKVAIRMRPLNKNEESKGRVWKVLPKYNSIAQTTEEGKPLPDRVTGRNFFSFDKTFSEESSTNEVYHSVVKNIVSSACTGLNGTVFAYGQTSSGKTFTMQGSGTIEEGSIKGKGGIVHLAAQDIFSHINDSQSREFSVRASFLEIYNEEVRDLLGESKTKPLQIREDPHRGVFVQAREEDVTDFSELLEVLFRGEKARSFASTAMNERSSRSHTIFRISIESREKPTESQEGDMEDESDGAVRLSTLNLVDLAGSESAKHTGTTGDRQKEGGMINQSLLTLSRVIVALGTPNQTHINFRDSKLTRLLQPSLSGNARMSVICCATPSKLYLEETRSTLSFASRAKLVKTNAQVNEVVHPKAIIRRLQQELVEARRAGGAVVDAGRIQKLEAEVSWLQDEMKSREDRIKRLNMSSLSVPDADCDRYKKRQRYSLCSPTLLSPPMKEKKMTQPKSLPRNPTELQIAPTQEIIMLRDALDTKHRVIEGLEVSHSKATQLVDSSQQELEAAKESNELLQSQHSTIAQRSNKLEQDISTLQSDHKAKVKEYLLEIEEKTKLIDVVTGQLRDEKVSLENAVSQLEILRGEKDAMEKLMNDTLEQVKAKTLEVSSLSDNAEELQSNLQQKDREVSSLKQQLESEIEAHRVAGERSNALQHEKTTLEECHAEQKQTWNESYSLLEKRLVDVNGQLDLRTSELSKVQAVHEAHVDDLGRMNSSIVELERQKKSSNEHISRLLKELETSKKSCEDIQAELDRRSNELESSGQKSEELREDLKASEKGALLVKEELETTKQTLLEREEAHLEELVKLQQSKLADQERAESEITVLKKALEEMALRHKADEESQKGAKASLETDYKTLQCEFESVKSELSSAKLDNEKLVLIQQQIQGEKEDQSKSVADLNLRVEELNQELVRHKADEESQKAANALLVADYNTLQCEFESVQKELSSAKLENTNLVLVQQQLQGEKEDQGKSVADLNLHLHELKEELVRHKADKENQNEVNASLEADHKTLKSEYDCMEKELSSAKLENENLMLVQQQFQRESEDQSKSIADLNLRVQELKEEIVQHEADAKSQKAANASLEADYKTVQCEFESVQCDLESVEKLLSSAKKDNEKLVLVQKKLQGEKEYQAKSVADLNLHVKELKEDLARHKMDGEGQKEVNASLEADCKTLKCKFESVEKELSCAKLENENLVLVQQQLQGENEDQSKSIADLNLHVQELKEELASQSSDYDLQLKALQCELTKNTQDYEDGLLSLNHQLEEKRDEATALIQERDCVKQLMQDYESECSASNGKVATLEKELMLAREDCASIQKAKDLLKKELEALVLAHNQQSELVSSMEASTAKLVADHNLSLLSMQDECNSQLKTQLDEISLLKSEITTKDDELGTLREDVADAQSRYKTLEADLSLAQEKCTSLESTMEILESEIVSLKCKEHQESESVETLKSEKVGLLSKMERMQTNITDLSRGNAELTLTVDRLKSYHSMAHHKNEVLARELSALQHRFTEADNRAISLNDSMEQRCAFYRGATERVEARVDVMASVLSFVSNSLDGGIASCKNLEQEKKELEATIISLRSSKQRASIAIEALSVALQKSNMELDNVAASAQRKDDELDALQVRVCQDCEKLSEKISCFEGEALVSAAELQDATTKCVSLESDLREATTLAELEQAEVISLKERLNSTLMLVEDREKTVQDLRDQVRGYDNLSTELSLVNSQKESSEGEVAVLTAEISELQQNYMTLVETESTLREENSDLAKSLNNSVRELNQARDSLANLDMKCKRLELEIDRSKEVCVTSVSKAMYDSALRKSHELSNELVSYQEHSEARLRNSLSQLEEARLALRHVEEERSKAICTNCENIEDEANNLQVEVAKLKRLAAEKDQLIHSLRSHNDQLSVERSKLQATLRDTEVLKETLRTNLETIHNDSASERDRFKVEVDRLASTIRDQENRLNEKEKELSAKSERIAKLEKVKLTAEHREKIAKMKSDLARSLKELGRTKKLLVEKESEISALQCKAVASGTTENSTSNLSQLEFERDATEKQLMKAVSRCQELENDLGNILQAMKSTGQFHPIDSTKIDIAAAVFQLCDKLSSMQASAQSGHRYERESLIAENASLSTQITSLQEQLASRSSQIVNTYAIPTDGESELLFLKDENLRLLKELSDMRKKVKESEAEISSLRVQLDTHRPQRNGPPPKLYHKGLDSSLSTIPEQLDATPERYNILDKENSSNRYLPPHSSTGDKLPSSRSRPPSNEKLPRSTPKRQLPQELLDSYKLDVAPRDSEDSAPECAQS